MWKNIVEPDRPQITIWRMRIESWVPKATHTHTHTHTHTQYVKLSALPLQQWLHEGVAKLRYTYIPSRVMSKWHKNHPWGRLGGGCGGAVVTVASY